MKPARIQAIFQFLKANAAVNDAIQAGFVREALSPAKKEDRAVLLMLHVLNTQSRPRLNEICVFLQDAVRSRKLSSCAQFRSHLTDKTGSDLWEALRVAPGWGEKTAALFLRNLAIVDRHVEFRQALWDDIDVIQRQEIRLPVDAVIRALFDRLGPLRDGSVLKRFDRINSYLRDDLQYTSEEIFLWDDLWFWGFITQWSKPKEPAREHRWNEAKYWSIPHAPKSAREVAQIEKKADQFLDLFTLAV